MAEKTPQTFENHARFFPPFHFVVLPLLTISLFGALYRAGVHFSGATLFDVGLAVALILLALSARMMAEFRGWRRHPPGQHSYVFRPQTAMRA